MCGRNKRNKFVYLNYFTYLCTNKNNKAMAKPVFYQLVPKYIPNVMVHVYGATAKHFTLEERLPNNGACPNCGKNEWFLLPTEGVAVREGGKAYIECINCGETTHL